MHLLQGWGGGKGSHLSVVSRSCSAQLLLATIKKNQEQQTCEKVTYLLILTCSSPHTHSEPSVDWINASPQAINLFPPAQEGLNPTNNESSSGISEDLSDHTPLHPGKRFFFLRTGRRHLCFLPIHTCCCESRIIHNLQNHFRNIQHQCRVFLKRSVCTSYPFYKKADWPHSLLLQAEGQPHLHVTALENSSAFAFCPNYNKQIERLQGLFHF